MWFKTEDHAQATQEIFYSIGASIKVLCNDKLYCYRDLKIQFPVRTWSASDVQRRGNENADVATQTAERDLTQCFPILSYNIIRASDHMSTDGVAHKPYINLGDFIFIITRRVLSHVK